MEWDSEDAELQRALALSLEQQNQSHIDDEATNDEELAKALAMSLEPLQDTSATSSYSSSHDLGDLPPSVSLPPPSLLPIPPVDVSSLSLPIQKFFMSASPIALGPIHDLLWDPIITVPNDQRRWLAQSIAFKGSTVSSTASPTPSFLPVVEHADLWGLVQAHGGPCGVLASIQAELLRLILFGIPTINPLTPAAADDSTSWRLPISVLKDTSSSSSQQHLFSPEELPAYLALSMGMIVARAAYQPSASLGDDATATNDTALSTSRTMRLGCVQLIFPKHLTEGMKNDQEDDDGISTHLEWCHLSPWKDAPQAATDPGDKKYLVSYTLSVRNDSHIQEDGPSDKNAADDNKEVALANAVARFLLETKLWQWYTRPGGVLLFVMALIQSRTTFRIKSDMDDADVKLTSQFGHCSQELLNLLLTGQAVSNVFDHTLRPSGDLICRGIQKRPTVGYLTLLESMRYLQVGGYYKRPLFPIWVIGSTSHFTVLFGDDIASCLHESKSEQIFESVRRAFQQMDGAEQGFIRLEQLGDFLQKLGLFERLGDVGVQTLGATMEVHGAGILLWEDIWKRTSRLLTGASLEAVLDSDDFDTNMQSSNAATESVILAPDPALVPPVRLSDAAPLSDEEYARQLQAEWDSQSDPTPPVSKRQTLGTPQQSPMQQQKFQRDSFGNSFRLFHYNGLRGGTTQIRPFHVTPLTSEEAIGASVSLLGASRPDSFMLDSPGTLQDVLRTKWPSCQIDWLSGSPPSID